MNHTNVRHILWRGAFLLALGLTACEVKRPEHVLTDPEMEAVLYDYHIAKAMGDQLPSDENYKRVLYVNAVFEKHGITEAEFDTSMVWFARNPEVIAKIYEKVNQRLKKEKEHIEGLVAIYDNRPKQSPSGDSVDVWIGPRNYRLAQTPLANKLQFTLPADTCFYDRDTLKWRVDFHFGTQTAADTLRMPLMALQIAYKNDSLVAQTRRITAPGQQTLTLWGDTLGPIKEVRGFVYMPAEGEGKELLLTRVALMRYHAKDSIAAAGTADGAGGKSPKPAPAASDSLRKEKPETLQAPAGNPAPTRRPMRRPSLKATDVKPDAPQKAQTPRR